MIKAALIDMDGVLYDSMPLHARAWSRMMSLLCINLPPEQFFRYEGMTGEATINLLAQKHLGKQFTSEECKELYRQKTEFFRAEGEAKPMPGAVEVLNFLDSYGIQCVLVTGSGQTNLIDRLQEHYPGIFKPECMVTSRNVVNGKPHPEPYLKGAKLAGCLPAECIAIDNAPLGVKSAHDAGVFTIGVTTGPIPGTELKEAGADVVVDSMSHCEQYLRHNLTNSGLPLWNRN